MKKLHLFMFVGLLFLFLQCKQEEKDYSFKKAKLNSSAIELIKKYIKYSNLPKGINEILIYKYISNSTDIWVINASKLTNAGIDDSTNKKDYVCFFDGFYVFINPELKDQMFIEDGIIKIPESKIEIIDDNDVPYTYDIISSWEFEIYYNKLINFKCQFCTLTENQIKDIESIIFY